MTFKLHRFPVRLLNNYLNHRFQILSNSNIYYGMCQRIGLIGATTQLNKYFSTEDERSESVQNSSPLKKNIKDVDKLLSNSTPFNESQFEDATFATTPYPEGTVFSQFSQGSLFLKPKCDPKDTSIILFPGQGTQFIGMGKDLLRFPVAKEMYEAASEVLGYNLLKVCLEGPIEKLSKTEYCQPAVLVTSLAAIEKLKERSPTALNTCIATAGFSLGEITALVFAGVISFERAVRLVKVRAEAMQLCAEMTPGGMLTLLLSPDSKLSDAIKDAKAHCSSLGIEKPECAVTNYLYPSAKIVGGHEEALKYITDTASKYKIKRGSRLPVSGAFHTRLMEPAADAVRTFLRKFSLNDPIIPVYRNIDGKMYRDGHHIAKTLPNQVMSEDFSNWKGCAPPQRKVMEGRYVRLEPLDPEKHGDDLYEVHSGPGADERLRYMWEVPETRENFQKWLENVYQSDDPLFYALIDKKTGKAGGRQSFLRTDAFHGVTEIGHIVWGPLIAQTPAAREAFYLFGCHIFDELGYRRFEWKAHNDNAASKAAAIKFGFTAEAVFRQHFVMKGKNRDTAWFAMIDKDWPKIKKALELWLDPGNFDGNGQQIKRLEDIRCAL